MDHIIRDIPEDQPVLIAGPTASGKSVLALTIAQHSGGIVVNADALQVFENWRILTARPSPAEEEIAPHALYGHVPGDQPYSVGHWLRDVTPFLSGSERPIIVGGTGLNFRALTEGLAAIPATPPEIREEGQEKLLSQGLEALLADLDPATIAAIDTLNPARVARAWEVQRTTGRGLAAWQRDTAPPLLPLIQTRALVLQAERDWLRNRITRRFDAMLSDGALEEVRCNLPGWDPAAPSSKAIGAPDLVAHLRGALSLEEARTRAIIASQQYAKRQRTWFRARMKDWQNVHLGDCS